MYWFRHATQYDTTISTCIPARDCTRIRIPAYASFATGFANYPVSWRDIHDIVVSLANRFANYPVCWRDIRNIFQDLLTARVGRANAELFCRSSHPFWSPWAPSFSGRDDHGVRPIFRVNEDNGVKVANKLVLLRLKTGWIALHSSLSLCLIWISGNISFWSLMMFQCSSKSKLWYLNGRWWHAL